MNQLIRATELHRKWENKQISDRELIFEWQKIIFELSDMVIALETEKAEMKDGI